VALEMDPERRRKLAELARWQDEWQAKHQVDDAELTLSGVEPENPPSPEAEWEFARKAREIMGREPEPSPEEKEEYRRKAREILGMDPEG
jgi:hypothetical protein